MTTQDTDKDQAAKAESSVKKTTTIKTLNPDGIKGAIEQLPPQAKDKADAIARRLKESQDRMLRLNKRLQDTLNAEAAKKAQDEQAKIRAAKRAKENQKYLLGATVQNAIEKGRITQEEVNSWLDEYLTKKVDRAKFGLPPKFKNADEIPANQGADGVVIPDTEPDAEAAEEQGYTGAPDAEPNREGGSDFSLEIDDLTRPSEDAHIL